MYFFVMTEKNYHHSGINVQLILYTFKTTNHYAKWVVILGISALIWFHRNTLRFDYLRLSLSALSLYPSYLLLLMQC